MKKNDYFFTITTKDEIKSFVISLTLIEELIINKFLSKLHPILNETTINYYEMRERD